MGKQVRKYNPGFLTPEELVDSFCVRTAEFGLIVQTLRESTGNSNSHQIVIGPRGSGKTTLLLRVAAEVNRDPDLQSAWFPIVFAEESYEVATCGEFWLQCLDNLAQQAPREYDQADLHLALDEFRSVQDDRTLADRCLAAILDFADSAGKRLVLIVENLNTLFDDIGDPDVGWQLRKTLQDEPRVLLLGSATARFEEIDNSGRALYDLFQVHTLSRLTPEGCATLWKSVSGRDIDVRVVRSLQILTGGNPRLLVIVAQFGAQLSFRELMGDLLNLVDEHTEYFRSHLESLGTQERRVYLALAVLWKPATAKQVSGRARIPTSQCSSLLGRLVQRGAVVRSGGTRHRREYYLAERMYNIYYLLRTSRGADSVVEALVLFMASYYSPAELDSIRKQISKESTSADELTRGMMQSALHRLAATIDLGREAIVPDHASSAPLSEVGDMVERARRLLGEDECDQAIEVCDEIVLRTRQGDPSGSDQHFADALFVKSIALGRLDQIEAAIVACDNILGRLGESDSPEIGGAVATAFAMKVGMFGQLGRHEKVLEASEAFLDRFESRDSPATELQRAGVLFSKGVALIESGQAQTAHGLFDELIGRFNSNHSVEVQEYVARAHLAKGGLLEEQGRVGEALNAYGIISDRFGSSKASRIVVGVATALLSKGDLLRKCGRFDEAREVFTIVTNRLKHYDSPDLLELSLMAELNGATMLEFEGDSDGAQQAYDAIVDRLLPINLPWSAEALVTTLLNKGNSLARASRYRESLAAYNRAIDLHGESRSPTVLEMVRHTLIGRAGSELALGRASKAIATIDEVLARTESNELGLIVSARMLRAEAHFDLGDRTACCAELATVLKLLPDVSPVDQASIWALINFAARLGPRPMLELIQESPSERILLPLATALRRELGTESKVPREVEEVAKDIQKDLSRLSQGRPQ